MTIGSYRNVDDDQEFVDNLYNTLKAIKGFYDRHRKVIERALFCLNITWIIALFLGEYFYAFLLWFMFSPDFSDILRYFTTSP